MPGRLIVCPTPIGNLGDLTPRVREALGEADLVACEDTRRAGRLYERLEIKPPRLVSNNDQNEERRSVQIAQQIERGARVALITDAGMPGISDPGERLVRAALAAGVAVDVVPGPSAALAALVVSGLPTARFVFEGFLPRKGRQRTARLAELKAEDRTVVLFEAPHRLEATLADLAAALGPDRPVAVAREITKRFETVWRGRLGQAISGDCPVARGEQVIVIGPAAPVRNVEPDDNVIEGALRAELAAGASRRDAAAVVADRLGVTRRRAYALANTLRGPTRS
jgi:16S rRNA (cytidine1402-2'-O)-methyltransferase